MFGYVRAVTSALPPEEARRYEAVYCGLCRTLGSRYGKSAQLILNYDFVFLALLLARPEGEGSFPTCPCPVHPWRKKTCWLGSPALAEAADATVILTWWKLQDAIRDGDWRERGKSRAAALALRGHYRAAAAHRPAFDRTVRTCWRSCTSWRRPTSPPWTGRRIPSPGFSRPPGRTRAWPPAPGPWSRSSTTWGGGSIWPTPGTTWTRTGRRGTTTPFWPGTGRRPPRRRPPCGRPCTSPGPGQDRLCPAGLGPVGTPAGAHPLHRPAGGGGGRLHRPVETAKAPLSPQPRACPSRGPL